MNGKIVASALAISGVAAGVAIYWLQVYAFYEPVPLTEIALGGESVAVGDAQAIDADSSPLRFRACFTIDAAATGELYPAPAPLTAPGWFDCFDAAAIGEALERGEARAYLSQSSVHPDVDRVVAIFPDGRGYAWHQLQPGVE